MVTNKFAQGQKSYGPYFFGVGGGDAAPSSTSGFASAPSITSSTPTTTGGFVSQGLGLSGFGGKAGTVASNIGLNLGLNALGIPAMATTVPVSGLLALSQLAHRAGLQGQDTSGMMGLDQGTIDAALGIAEGSGPNTAANLQGTGLTPGQMATISLHAMGVDPGLISGQNANPDPTSNPDAGLVAAGAGPAGVGPGPAGAPGGSAGAPSGGGDSGNPGDFHKGGKVKPGAPKGPERRATLLEGEYVIERKAYTLHKDLVEAINRGDSRSQLAAIAKAGR